MVRTAAVLEGREGFQIDLQCLAGVVVRVEVSAAEEFVLECAMKALHHPVVIRRAANGRPVFESLEVALELEGVVQLPPAVFAVSDRVRSGATPWAQ